ncbi:hypothetical protein BKA57DRAFT_185335 [Linnemannia elongata]|nr:hypothetical protein BKA57DRAFT_185335 [Linnemannia elongata]
MSSTLGIKIVNSDRPAYTIQILYNPTDPLSILFKRIHARLGTDEKSVYHQDLLLHGTPLEDHSRTLEDYCNVDGQTTLTYHALSFRSRTEGDLVVLVNVLYGETYTLHFAPETTISEVKTVLHLLSGLVPSAQILIFAGKKLEDECSLTNYGIGEGSIIHLVRRRPGGAAAPHCITFSDISDTSGLRKIETTEPLPPGSITFPGTNVECVCNCTSTHRVVCKKAFGTLTLSESFFVCPNCGESDGIIPVTVGFRRCKYRFRGTKASGELYTSDWKEVTTDDCYQLFESSREISWHHLDIETASLDYDECPICLEPMKESETLECDHHFHSECINNWTGSCPTCRHERRPSVNSSDGTDDSGEDIEDTAAPPIEADGVGSLPAESVNVET